MFLRKVKKVKEICNRDSVSREVITMVGKELCLNAKSDIDEFIVIPRQLLCI